MYVHDTIVAPSTAPGQGAIAIVRLSGPRAIEIAHTVWRPVGHRLSGCDTPVRPHRDDTKRLRLGEIRDPETGSVVDRGMCVVMPGPHSFTGEDIAELHCHGGVYLVRRLIALTTAAGARLAEPGEFTRRAFLNGRIDLTEAEAIADLISARGERALRQAVAHLSGALAERVRALRKGAIAIRAHLEAEIDFADEDIRLPSRNEIAAEIDVLIKDVTLLYDSYARGRLARDGIRIAIVGKPNAGKSSIMNLLLGTERAIVTPIPGTTRDVVEDSIQLGGFAAVLQDTAGVRDSLDPVERIGVERTRASASAADLLITVFDASRSLTEEDRDVIALSNGRPGIAMLNKCDLPGQLSTNELCLAGLALPISEFSAIEPSRVPELKDRLKHQIELLTGGPLTNDIIISRERHRGALAQTREAFSAARASALAGLPPEIVAVDIGAATESLALLTGEVSTEDVLDAVFREFCIGK